MLGAWQPARQPVLRCNFGQRPCAVNRSEGLQHRGDSSMQSRPAGGTQLCIEGMANDRVCKLVAVRVAGGRSNYARCQRLVEAIEDGGFIQAAEPDEPVAFKCAAERYD